MIERIDRLLSLAPKPSQEKFLRSVRYWVSLNPHVFPTDAQLERLKQIEHHLEKQQMILALGTAIDCLSV